MSSSSRSADFSAMSAQQEEPPAPSSAEKEQDGTTTSQSPNTVVTFLPNKNRTIISHEHHAKLRALLERVQDHVERMENLGHAVYDDNWTDEEVWEENASLFEDTKKLFGCIPHEDNYKEMTYPLGFLEYWNRIYEKGIDEWWTREFFPTRDRMMTSLGLLESGELHRYDLHNHDDGNDDEQQ